MPTKNVWKEVAARRLAENLAFRVVIAQMDHTLREKHGKSRIRALYRLVRVAKEIGK
jgi:hypothetical protein